MEPNIVAGVDALIGETKDLRSELDRVRASRHPSKAGVGVFAKFVVPSGYKRLAREVGSLWLDSSYQNQMKRLEGVGEAWRQRVVVLLGTSRTLPSEGRHGMSSRQLQVSFAKTQRYDRFDARLKNAMSFLDDLKHRDLVSAREISKAAAPVQAESQSAAPTAKVANGTTAMQSLFPSSVVEKLPNPVRKSIEQAVESYQRAMYEPAAVMLRKAVQNAIVLRFEAEGIGDQVLRQSGDALPFPELIGAAQRARLISSQQAKELMRVKWLGDTAAHSYSNDITREDLDGVLLIVRLTLERIFTIQIRPTGSEAD